MRTRGEINSTEWIGEIPDGWDMIPLPRLFTSSKGMTVTRADLIDEGAPVVNYAQVHSKANSRFGISNELIKHIPREMVPKGLKESKRGSFIFACTSEDLAGCGDCIYNDSNQPLNPGGDTLLLSPNGDVENKYLAYLFSTDMWRRQIRRDLVDVKVFHVNQGNLHETYVVVPPVDVQAQIVSYLDERCAAIDEDVAKRREIIEKLREYKKSLIAHAVTRGLDPKAEMRDSGVEWIGEVPAEWEIHYPKALFFMRNERMKPGDTQLTASQEYGVIPQTEFQEREGRRVVQVILNPDILKHVEVGDFVMHMRSFQGGLELADRPGCVSSAYVMLHRRNDKVRDGFFKYLFKSSAYIDALRSTSNLIRDGQALRFANFIQVYLPLPSIDEQDRIADYLDERCAAIDEAISRQEQLIEKLEEYHKSIIHHAVTGKIDCSEA